MVKNPPCNAGKPFNIIVIQVYAPSSNADEAEAEDLQDLLELTPQNRCLFLHRGQECKSRKSRNTRNNRQIWPWSTEWSREKANRVLPGECTQWKHSLPTTQEKTLHMDITTWSILKPEADCGSDNKLFIAKIRFKLKKVGKTTRLFRYDLNQIP